MQAPHKEIHSTREKMLELRNGVHTLWLDVLTDNYKRPAFGVTLENAISDAKTLLAQLEALQTQLLPKNEPQGT